jgi:hypothetical protein
LQGLFEFSPDGADAVNGAPSGGQDGLICSHTQRRLRIAQLRVVEPDRISAFD